MHNPIFAIRREEFKINRSEEFQRLADLGIAPNASTRAQWNARQVDIDRRFELSAKPVFYTMLGLSVATFCAAFIQVNSE